MTAIAFADEEVRALMMAHRLNDPALVHTNLQALLCACLARVVPVRPQQTGNTCLNCGGMAVQTGTCTTCVECGTTGGCG